MTPSARTSLARPKDGEFDPASSGYIALAPPLDDVAMQMRIQRDAVRKRLTAIDPAKAGYRYASGENDYVPTSGADDRALGDLVGEGVAVREATLALVSGFPPHAWARRGTANGWTVTTAALAYIIYGHVAHHLRMLDERYGV